MQKTYRELVVDEIRKDLENSLMGNMLEMYQSFNVEVGPMSFEVSYRRFDGIARDMTKIYIRVFVGNGKVMPIAIDI